MPGKLLTLEGVRKAFGAHKVLDGIDLGIETSEIVGLLGPNGSGKSTLLNVISGFMSLDAGQVSIEGRAISRLPADAVVKAGLVRTFQLPSMPTRMTVREVLQAGSSGGAGVRSWFARPRFDADLDSLLDQFKLSHVADLPASALSGGQKKLLSIATALRAHPRLLCLDEPTAGVHPELRTEIVNILRACNAQGVTILVVEHDMMFIRDLCRRAVVLDRGELIADCAPKDLESNPRVVEAYLGKAVKKGKVRT